MPISLNEARRAKAALKKKLAGLDGLIGVGITKRGDDYGLKVNVDAMPDEPIPTSFDGVPVQVEVVGRIRKRGDGLSG